MSFLRRLFPVKAKQDFAVLDSAIQRAIERIDPRLKQMRGYPQVYRRPMQHALDYCHDLAARVPGPLPIDRDHYAHNPQVHALFASLEEVRDALCSSRVLRDYLHAHPLATETYVLLGMYRHRETRLGAALEGDTVRREVPMQVVYFSDHSIDIPAPDEASAREGLTWYLFDALITHVAQRIHERAHQREVLEKNRDELMARLKTAPSTQRQVVQTDLNQVFKRLQSQVASMDLIRYRDDISAVCFEPSNFLYLESVTFQLNAMGISDASDSQEVIFYDLIGVDAKPRTVVLAHCRNLDPKSYANRLENASLKLTPFV